MAARPRGPRPDVASTRHELPPKGKKLLARAGGERRGSVRCLAFPLSTNELNSTRRLARRLLGSGGAAW
jgi:hypothetical protein